MQNKMIPICFVIIFFYLFYASPAIAEIKVFDANNKYVGILLETGFITNTFISNITGKELITVFIPPYGIAVIARKDTNNMGALYYASNMRVELLFFESNNCSGTAYIETEHSSRYIEFPAIFPVFGKYYVLDSKKPVATFRPLSRMEGSQTGNGTCNAYQENIQPLHALTEIPLNLLPFPVTYPLRFEYSEYLVGDINGDGRIGLSEAINALQIGVGIR